MAYYMSKTVTHRFDEAVAQTVAALKAQGFGVLTEIDVQDTLKKKLGVDFRKYRILGACNPPFAYQALQAEDHIGILMPCNVIVQEFADGRVEVATVDPLVSMQATGNPKLGSYAQQVHDKLAAALASLS
jgi:uncharacterized protein (DUF302 family)